MFNKPVILSSVKDEHVYEKIEVEYANKMFVIKIEETIKDSNAVWFIYLKEFDKFTEKYSNKLIAYSRKEYSIVNLENAENDAFKYIQKISEIMEKN